MAVEKSRRSGDSIWTFSTYFTEGFPFAIIRTLSGLFFRDMKVSLEGIGLTSLFGLPWTLKFLWAPGVGEYGTRRRWLLLSQVLFLLILALATMLVPLKSGALAFAILFFVGAFIAATQDIAVDGYYMERLDSQGQAKYLGLRVMAYRVAMIVGPGVVAMIGTRGSWLWAFSTATLIFGAFVVFHLFYLPEATPERRPLADIGRRLARPATVSTLALTAVAVVGMVLLFNSSLLLSLKHRLPFLKGLNFASGITLLLLLAMLALIGLRGPIRRRLQNRPDSYYSQAFLVFVDQPRIGVILSFLILLRAGEYMQSTMIAPFLVDIGIKTHYGWISGYVGFPLAIAGALVGGWAISRWGMKKAMWPFIVAQNLTSLVYMALASHLASFETLNRNAAQPVSIGVGNLLAVAGVHGLDQFSSGLGNAVLITFLMGICHKDFKAAHYAFGSALWSIGGLVAGLASGSVASWLGYARLFGVSFLISVPAMLLIPFLPLMKKSAAPSG